MRRAVVEDLDALVEERKLAEPKVVAPPADLHAAEHVTRAIEHIRQARKAPPETGTEDKL